MDTPRQHTTGTNPCTHSQPCTTAVQQHVVQQWHPRSHPPTHHVLYSSTSNDLQQYSTRRHLRISYVNSASRLISSPVSAEMLKSNFLLGEEVHNAKRLKFKLFFLQRRSIRPFFLQRLWRMFFPEFTRYSFENMVFRTAGIKVHLGHTFNDSVVALLALRG